MKRTVEATRKPSISPTTTMQAMTEPNRHQLITRMTPPTTPITADTARQTAQRRKQTEVKGPPISDTVALIMWADRKLCWLTVIVQFYGPCHQHEEEKRCKAKSHAKQLCMTERHQERFRAAEHNAVTLHVTVMQPQKQTSRHSTHKSRYITLLEVDEKQRPFLQRETHFIISSNSHLSNLLATVAHRSHEFRLEQTHFCITCDGDHMRGRPPPHPTGLIFIHITNTWMEAT